MGLCPNERKISMKKILAIVLTLVMLLSCAAFAEEAKPVILVVSFGTSYNDNRDLSIGAVEEAIQAAYPEWEVRRAFTAQTVIDILDERDAIDTDMIKIKLFWINKTTKKASQAGSLFCQSIGYTLIVFFFLIF